MDQNKSKTPSPSLSLAEELMEKLSAIEEISMKKMFGGAGIMYHGKMFGIVSAKCELFFKVNEESEKDYIQKQAKKHSRMPYYTIPDDVWTDNNTLISWAKKSIGTLEK